MKPQKEKEEICERNKNLVYLVLKEMHLYYRLDELYDIGLIGMAKGINKYDKTKGFKESTFLTKCIKNEILHFITREKIINVTSYNVEISDDGAMLVDFIEDEKINIQEDLNKKAEKNMVRVALKRIKPFYQEVLIPYFGIGCESKSMKEIGNDLGISYQAVGTRIKRGLEKVKKILEERYEYNDKTRY